MAIESVEFPPLGSEELEVAVEHSGLLPASDGAAYVQKFKGKYRHRIVAGAGHNLPAEAPLAFAEAVVEVDRD